MRLSPPRIVATSGSCFCAAAVTVTQNTPGLRPVFVSLEPSTPPTVRASLFERTLNLAIALCHARREAGSRGGQNVQHILQRSDPAGGPSRSRPHFETLSAPELLSRVARSSPVCGRLIGRGRSPRGKFLNALKEGDNRHSAGIADAPIDPSSPCCFLRCDAPSAILAFQSSIFSIAR